MNHQILRIKIDASPFVYVCVSMHACCVCLRAHCMHHLQSYSVSFVENMMHIIKGMSLCLNSVSKCTTRLHVSLHFLHVNYFNTELLRYSCSKNENVLYIKELADRHLCSRPSPSLTAIAGIVCRL